MPSSRYVYVDANDQAAAGVLVMLPNRRRSQGIRRRTHENIAHNNSKNDSDDDDAIDDPDETVLEEQRHGVDDDENDGGEDDESEGPLLSDGENAPPPPRSDDMDVDEKCPGGYDPNCGKRWRNVDSTPFSTSSSAGRPMEIRGGAKGYLSNDPLTSSTMKSTPFSAIRARNAKKNSRVSAKERLRNRFADRLESDESDEDGDIADMSEREFLREVARKRAQREAVLAESQQQQQQQQSFASSRMNESFENEQRQSIRHDESDATNRIGNNGASSSNHRSSSESFGATQPWEKELDGLPFYQRNAPDHNQHKSNKETQSSINIAQPQIQWGRMEEDQSNHQATQSHTHFDSQLIRIANNGASSSHRQSFPEPLREEGSVPLSRYEQNAPKKVPHRQENNRNKSKQSTNDSQPQIQWGRRKEDQSNSLDPAPSHKSHQNNYSTITNQQQNIRRNHGYSESINQDSSSSTANTDLRKPPPPPYKSSAVNMPKISFESIKSRQQGNMSGKSSNSSRGDDNSNINSNSKGDTWREEAFRSSLLDLFGSFPANFFDYQDENQRIIFASESIDDESPHSTTQKAVSSQLNRKRLFDAASRSLARLAIASRHTRKKDVSRNNGNHAGGGSSDDGESPDFDPPSPRSLPAYMSVMNVHDDSSPGSSSYREAGNASAMLSSSKDLFSGQSVHGRNARTFRLSKVPQGNSISSSNPYYSWSSEELAFGSLMLAAQVCHEASCDANVEGKHRPPISGADSRRDAGYARNSSKEGGNEKRPEVLTSLVESCLGFLATAFACLESDFVYSVLKSTLRSHSTVFDALSQFAPVSSQDDSLGEVCTVSALSLLALSRGLEAAISVAIVTSLDPSSACIAYSSPHKYCGTNTNIFIDAGIDEGGVGWSSALGRDLGLKLEDHRNSYPRHMHLSKIAGYAYDVILDFNPMIVDDGVLLSHGMQRRDDRGVQKRGESRGIHYIDTQGGKGISTDAVACRQPAVMKDRMYAANVEYLASLIRAGIVSGWLTNSPSPVHEGGDSNDSRTVDKLCQKLFFVIEIVSRRRRSTNQNIASPDPGDSEAVCAASLRLLILALPEHVHQLEPSSLSTSFRQMGNSTASVDDLLHSPLLRRMVEMALSWQDPRSMRGNNKENNSDRTNQATSNALYLLGDLSMVGGSSLIYSHFSERLENFLQTITNSISERGRMRTADHYFDDSNIDSCLFFVLLLHARSPIMVRTFIRDFIESDNDYSFVGGLLHLATNESFSVSSCASSLLRALVDGNPADRTYDLLSKMMLNSFDTEQAGSDFEDALRFLLESTFTSHSSNIPSYSISCYPRICLLGDVLGIFILTTSASKIFASSMSDEVLTLLGDILEHHNQSIDTLSGSAKMSIVNLFTSFATNCRKVISNDESGAIILAQQRLVKEKMICVPGHVTVLEAAMAQGTSADMTYRALKLQSSLLSLSDERFLAHILASSRNSVAKKERILRDKLSTYQSEIRELVNKCQQSELDCDGLTESLREQRFAYERQLEWRRSESMMASRNASEIFVYERKLAEERFTKECEARRRSEQENEQLTRDCTSYKSRIKELEQLLGHEQSSREDVESALGSCKHELSTTSKEVERLFNICHDLQEKLSVSEEKVLHLSAISEESEATLEDVCSKLIKLSTIYQVKEHEMDKYKAELRSAVNTANRHADTAIQKYEYCKQENLLMRKKYEEVKGELNDIKARRADIQRMRKNAPVTYINQLHKDPKVPQRITGPRRSPRQQGKN